MIQDSRKIKEFTDLKVWQEAHKLVLQVYKFSKNFPKSELFGLTSQMQRAAVSITSNIAEGFGRNGYREKIQFYYVAHGSLTELKNQFFIAKDVGYLKVVEFDMLYPQANIAHQLLQGLIRKSKELSNIIRES